MKKTTLFYIIISVALALTLGACASSKPTSSLIGTSWKLVSQGTIAEQIPAVAGVETNLTLGADGKLSGNLGCNSMGGEYSISGQTITFKNIYATEMACADPQMAQEGEAFVVLQGDATYKIDGSTLTITSTDGQDSLTFTANSK